MKNRILQFLSPPAVGSRRLDKWDGLAALLVGAGSLGVYLRTLAPGLLYRDSAEFQTLAATLGVAHPSGYAPYLLLARGFSWLPWQDLAWRANLLSAVMGALALVGIYWMIRRLEGSRSGAVLGAALVGVGRTFWSQAVIAEVYTLAAAAVLVLGYVIVLLYHYIPLLSGKTLGLPDESLYGIIMFQFIPFMIIAGVLMTFFNRKTGRVYVGAFLFSMLLTWIVVASTAIHFAF